MPGNTYAVISSGKQIQFALPFDRIHRLGKR
jgi:hypothetical protein